jgi:hypothetical protein
MTQYKQRKVIYEPVALADDEVMTLAEQPAAG